MVLRWFYMIVVQQPQMLKSLCPFDWNGIGHPGSGSSKGYKLNADTTDFGSGLQFGTRTNGLAIMLLQHR